jgi:LPS-assembly lipoprotein
MSLADVRNSGAVALLRPALLIAAVGLLSLAAGCQARPLYGSGATLTSGATGEVTPLSSISVKAVGSRPAQIVRNQLVFLLNGGAQPQATTRYSVGLNVSAGTSSAAYVQRTSEDEPTAGSVTMRGAYDITDNTTGQVIRTGSRQVVSSFDVPRQQFSALRAERDAQERAGRELAELLRLAIAQDLSQPAGFDSKSSVSAPIAEVTPRPGNQTRGSIAN